jgi:hypothetical protein
MKIIGPDKTCIDYFQGVCVSQEGLANLFGLRVGAKLCLAVVKDGDGKVNTYGTEFRMPVDLTTLPSHVRMIVDNHMLNYPASDLIGVLTGAKSFQEALESSTKGELKGTTANATDRSQNNGRNYSNERAKK